MSRTELRRFLNAAGRLLSILSIAFIAWLVYRQRHEILSTTRGFSAYWVLAVIVAIYLVNQVLSSLVLAFLCRAPARWLAFIKIQAMSQIAKYLPGNVFQFVGRVAMADEVGLTALRMSLMTVVELAVVVASGMLISVACLAFASSPVARDIPQGMVTLAKLACVLAAAGGLLAIAFSPIARLEFRGVRLRRVVWAVIFYVPIFTGNALALYLLAETHTAVHFIDALFANTVAWVAGFVVPGAPGGIGIREAVLYKLFSSDAASSFVIFLVVVLRLCSVVSDVLFYMIGLLLRALPGGGRH